jgi:hypothetical protein
LVQQLVMLGILIMLLRLILKIMTLPGNSAPSTADAGNAL